MKVRIKTWTAMAEQYGIDNNTGEVACTFGFIDTMEEQMPEDRVIEIEYTKDVIVNGKYVPEYLWDIGNEFIYWSISEDMIEEWIER